MRWNCPHCQAAISIDESQLDSGWNFARCFRCSGHALVRRSEVNIVRLDRTPQEEKVLQTREPGMTVPHASAIAAPSLQVARPANLEPAAPPVPAAAPVPAAILESAQPLENESMLEMEIPMENTPSARRMNVSRLTLGFAAALALTSGVSLYRQGKRMAEQLPVAPVAQAPIAAVQAPAQAPAPENVAANAEATPPLFANLQNHPAVISDSVTSAAMAPQRETRTSSPLVVQVWVEKAVLRAGPGQESAPIGTTHNEMRYTLADYQDRWFKVWLPAAEGQPKKTAWIRNDLVKFVSP